MSVSRQRPDHLLIREYIGFLRDKKMITQESLCDAFVPVYLEMIPPSEDVPCFELPHRHDTIDAARRKEGSNIKKLWRAIDGATFFPLAYKQPLIVALEKLGKGQGVSLQKILLHNAGLCYVPVMADEKSSAIYASFIKEFAEANSQMVSDYEDDGLLNNLKTRDEVLDSLDKHYEILREIERNRMNKNE